MFLRRLFRLLPTDPFTGGLQCMDRGRLRQALQHFEPLLDSADEGTRSMARLYSCECWLQLGDEIAASDPEAGLDCFEHAAALQPGFADVQHRVGRGCLRLERFPEAIEALRRALEINPRFFTARLDLIEALQRAGRSESVEAEIERLADLAPDLFHDDVALLRQAAQTGNAEAVFARLDAMRDHQPSPRERLRREALQALREERPERAVEILADLLETGRRFPDLLLLQGLALARMERARAAEDAFREALAIHPGYTKARINLALALMEQGRNTEAERELRTVLEHDPVHPLALSALEEIQASRVEF